MRVKLWTIKELLSVSTDYLKEKQIDSPRLTAEVLLAFQLNLNRVKLYLNLDLPLSDSEVSGYRELIRRRIQREPLQYITGVQEFWSLDFQVDPRVLIPRPETELLVEQAKERIKDTPGAGGGSFIILDLGTGSGALAVTLAKEIQGARLWATDISLPAIDLARLNAERHTISDRIEFRQGDLFHALSDPNITFDLIVSNPPYIGADEYDDLQPEVRDHEPRVALDGREGGIYYIQKIIEGCTNFLKPGGWLLLEMSPGQTKKAIELIKRTKTFEKETRIKDFNQLYRMVCAKKRGLE